MTADVMDKRTAEAFAEPDLYLRALKLSDDVQRVDDLVRLLCTTAPTDQPFCHGCLWERFVKPLVEPFIGTVRAYPFERHITRGWHVVPFDPTTLLEPEPSPNQAEEWLRSSEAWDAVTDKWLAMLAKADPALGHGFPKVGDR